MKRIISASLAALVLAASLPAIPAAAAEYECTKTQFFSSNGKTYGFNVVFDVEEKNLPNPTVSQLYAESFPVGINIEQVKEAPKNAYVYSIDDDLSDASAAITFEFEGNTYSYAIPRGYELTYSDCEAVLRYVSGADEYGYEAIQKYDIDYSGVIDIRDLVGVSKRWLSVPMNFVIDGSGKRPEPSRMRVAVEAKQPTGNDIDFSLTYDEVMSFPADSIDENYININIDDLPSKLTYRLGEELDLSGCTASANGCNEAGQHWDIFETSVLNDKSFTVETDFDSSVPGVYTVTITVSDDYSLTDSQSFEVKVLGEGEIEVPEVVTTTAEETTVPEITTTPYEDSTNLCCDDTSTDETEPNPIDPEKAYADILIDSLPDKTVYLLGEELDLTGCMASAYGRTNSGVEWDIPSTPVPGEYFTVEENFNSSVVGENIIYITYDDGESMVGITSFIVTVIDPDATTVTEEETTREEEATEETTSNSIGSDSDIAFVFRADDSSIVSQYIDVESGKEFKVYVDAWKLPPVSSVLLQLDTDLECTDIELICPQLENVGNFLPNTDEKLALWVNPTDCELNSRNAFLCYTFMAPESGKSTHVITVAEAQLVDEDYQEYALGNYTSVTIRVDGGADEPVDTQPVSTEVETEPVDVFEVYFENNYHVASATQDTEVVVYAMVANCPGISGAAVELECDFEAKKITMECPQIGTNGNFLANTDIKLATWTDAFEATPDNGIFFAYTLIIPAGTKDGIYDLNISATEFTNDKYEDVIPTTINGSLIIGDVSPVVNTEEMTTYEDT